MGHYQWLAILHQVYVHIMSSLVENEQHCEFVQLRNFIVRTFMQDLIDTTAEVHYEGFRTRQLLVLKGSSQLPTSPPN